MQLPDASSSWTMGRGGFGCRRCNEWSSHGTRVLIVSKDDALENTVALLRQRGGGNIRALFMTPTSINGAKDLTKRVAAL
jgi:hypothetical protein